MNRNLKVVEGFADKIEVLPILPCLSIYGKEKAKLKTQGTPIGDLDLFIGSTAIVYDMVVVARNLREFERIEAISH